MTITLQSRILGQVAKLRVTLTCLQCTCSKISCGQVHTKIITICKGVRKVPATSLIIASPAPHIQSASALASFTTHEELIPAQTLMPAGAWFSPI